MLYNLEKLDPNDKESDQPARNSSSRKSGGRVKNTRIADVDPYLQMDRSLFDGIYQADKQEVLRKDKTEFEIKFLPKDIKGMSMKSSLKIKGTEHSFREDLKE